LQISTESHVYLSLHIGGRTIPFITDSVIGIFIVTAAIVIFAVLSTRKLNKVPKGLQKAAEYLVEFINNLLKSSIHDHYKAFSTYICTFLLFIGFADILSIFNFIPTGHFLANVFNNPSLEHFELPIEPPTKNFNVTLALALTTIVFVIVAEFRFKGFKGWLKGFYKPNPIYGFVRILDYFIRPLSLCLRLFGNILGGFIAVSLAYTALPIIFPIIVNMYFDLFDGLLQAYVFVFLTVMYLSEAVEVPEEVN